MNKHRFQFLSVLRHLFHVWFSNVYYEVKQELVNNRKYINKQTAENQNRKTLILLKLSDVDKINYKLR